MLCFVLLCKACTNTLRKAYKNACQICQDRGILIFYSSNQTIKRLGGPLEIVTISAHKTAEMEHQNMTSLCNLTGEIFAIRVRIIFNFGLPPDLNCDLDLC